MKTVQNYIYQIYGYIMWQRCNLRRLDPSSKFGSAASKAKLAPTTIIKDGIVRLVNGQVKWVHMLLVVFLLAFLKKIDYGIMGRGGGAYPNWIWSSSVFFVFLLCMRKIGRAHV